MADLSLTKSTTFWSQQRKGHPIASGRRPLFQHAKPSRRLWGYGAFLVMSVLSASFYPVAKPTLDHLDMALFLAGQMVWLLPPAFFLLFWSRWSIRWSVLLWGED